MRPQKSPQATYVERCEKVKIYNLNWEFSCNIITHVASAILEQMLWHHNEEKKIVESWCNQYKITGELELVEIVQREESHNFVFKTVCVLARFRTEYISLVKLT